MEPDCFLLGTEKYGKMYEKSVEIGLSSWFVELPVA